MTEVWFDPESGELIEVKDSAIPLREILLGDNLDLDPERYASHVQREHTEDYVLAVGRLMVAALRDETDLAPLTEDHLKRLNLIGLMPDRSYIQRHFGSFSEFRRKIEANRQRPSSDFDILSSTDVYNLVFEVHSVHGDGGPLSLKLLEKYYNFGLTPGYTYLYHRFGGIQRLNEHLGYPDVRNWDYTDFLHYGASVLQENGPDSLTIHNVEKLARTKFGPHPLTIKRRFGAWDTYKKLSYDEFNRQQKEFQSKELSIQKHFEDLQYGNLEPEDPILRRRCWAQYHVAADCVHNADEKTFKLLALLPNDQFIEKLRILEPKLAVADIEIAALALHVSDDIWPPLYRRKPKLNAE